MAESASTTNDEEMKSMTDEVVRLTEEIKPMLAGHKPEVQSAVLAELLATWVLGFQVPGNPKAGIEMQDKFLAGHLNLMMELIKCQQADAYKEVMRRN
jgi:hypothetical protein